MLTKVTTPTCMVCKTRTTMDVPLEGFRLWQNGVYIQDALSMLTPDQREMLMSGTHPACWEKVFGPEIEDVAEAEGW